MASPQTENGYTKIANELLESLSALQVSGSEWSVLMCIIRKTYGFHKKEDWVTNTQIALMTGLHKVRVSEAKTRLVDAKIVTEKRNKLSLNKDYAKWKKLRKSVMLVTEIRNNCYGKAYPQKIKETTTKETSEANASQSLKNGYNDMSKFNQLGAEIIKALESIDPKNKNYYGNKTQRAACDFLIEEYGLEEVKNRIAIVEKTNEQLYFPTITTPCQLRDKWVTLENALKRYQKESGKNTVAF